MLFKASSMYCKFVIDLININIKKLYLINKADIMLDDALYESYIQLEKILKLENS